MKLKINGEQTERPDSTTLPGLAEEFGIAAGGGAIAVNDTVIRRPNWPDFQLKDGDDVVVIKASYGR